MQLRQQNLFMAALGAVTLLQALLLTAVSAHSVSGLDSTVAFPPPASISRRGNSNGGPACSFASCEDFKTRCVQCIAKNPTSTPGCFDVTISMTGAANCPKTGIYSWASCCRDRAHCLGIKCSLTATTTAQKCTDLGTVVYSACPDADGIFGCLL